jgi:hypothetical protein
MGKIKENIIKFVKENWTFFILLGLVLLFFFTKSTKYKLIIGGITLFYVAIFEYFIWNREEVARKMAFYSSSITVLLGISALLTAFLLPKNLSAFIITFIILVLFACLFFIFKGPKTWFKVFICIIFIIPIGALIYAAISGGFNLMLQFDWKSPLFYLFLFLTILGVIVLFSILYSFSKYLRYKFPNKKIFKILFGNFGVFLFLFLLIILFYFLWKKEMSLDIIINKIVGPIIVLFSLIQIFYKLATKQNPLN